MFEALRRTSNDKLGGVIRLMLGFVFLLAGILKIVVPQLGEAFSGQLTAAGIPLHGFVLFWFPIVESVLGVMLAAGLHTRIVAAISCTIMLVAAYVHVVADDPALFPLQPVEPVGPVLLSVLLIYPLWRGGGAWSMDLGSPA